jgi:hypothetical protein
MLAGVTTRPGIIGVMTIGLVALVLAGPAFAQEVTKQDIPGIRNFARVETTVACVGGGGGGQRRRRGGRSGGRRPELHTHPVQRARTRSRPGDQVPRRDLSNDASPAYIHCAGGPRAAMTWLVKRLVVDGWDTEKAMVEVADLDLTLPRLKDFAIEYASAHKR